MNYGFVKVCAAVPEMKVADINFNTESIIKLMQKAYKKNTQIIVFPELCLTGYTCGDLFQQQILLDKSIEQLGHILTVSKDLNIISIIGMPIKYDNQLFNCAVVIKNGNILGVVPKSFIPGYSEFYEERWFSSGKTLINKTILLCGQNVPLGIDILFGDSNNPNVCFGIEICEDLWTPTPPSSYQSMGGATILFNLSASNEIIGKYQYREELVSQQSAKCITGYIYTSSNINESTTDVVFGGHAIICEYGTTLVESQRFLDKEQIIFADIDVDKLISDRLKNTSFMEALYIPEYRKIEFDFPEYSLDKFDRKVNAYPFVPSDLINRNERCKEIFSIQTSALGKRLKHTGIQKAVLGISGGLDSTLALLVVAKAFDELKISRENIIAITMPGFGTTNETYTNSINLMKSMNVSIREINIKDSCLQHFKDIGHDPSIHDLTYENVQARERTQILMDIANKIGALVIGTGDLSELALGWCTYNGDHMSMYSVNCGIPKTLVKFLVEWVADNKVNEKVGEVLHKIINTPISPELLPPTEKGEINQKTEDIIGPYELHDFFLYHMVRYGATPKKIFFLAKVAFEWKYTEETIKNWLTSFYKRFFSQQFKRSCLPDGPKVGTISLSPRGDWRMPSDAVARVWLDELK